MRELEDTILRAAVATERWYSGKTNYWLSHAPEFLITAQVARGIGRKNWEPWCDASPRKIIRANRAKPVGRPQNDSNQRFDIVVWHKTSYTVKALIEVKRAWSAHALMKDATKLRRQGQRTKASIKSGYLLVYSDAVHKKAKRTGKETLRRRFDDWKQKLRARSIQIRAYAPRQEDAAWGFVLLRVF